VALVDQPANTQSVDRKRQLGEFLQARRSQVTPQDVGLRTYGDLRRVAGLRREEIAALAGVSPSYYSRLEQGQSLNASAEILDAIATALRLDDAERHHLHDLAAASRSRPSTKSKTPVRATPAMTELLENMSNIPSLVLDHVSDVVAWNVAGHGLYAGHLDFAQPDRTRERPNMARLMFLDGHTRELYVDWPAKARAVVASLRSSSGQNPGDTALAQLVGELSMASPEFSSLWANHRVKAGGAATYAMQHPLVGLMQVTQQTLVAEKEQRLVVASTEPGSSSREAMTLLIHTLTSTTTAQRVRQPTKS
jgi:transcriptional regulator with XRE-family HTH domain